MPSPRSIASVSVAEVSVSPVHFIARFAFCAVLTMLDIGVLALFGETLYQATAHHPLWFIGVNFLFASLLSSLASVIWNLMLRGRSR